MMIACHIPPPLRNGPVKVCLFSPLYRIVRISSLLSRIVRSFFFSLWSVVVVVFSCNILRLLTVFFLLLFVWYGIPPSFSVCLANGSLLDFLVGSNVFGFSILIPCSGVKLLSLGRSCNSSSVCVDRLSFGFVITLEISAGLFFLSNPRFFLELRVWALLFCCKCRVCR